MEDRASSPSSSRPKTVVLIESIQEHKLLLLEASKGLFQTQQEFLKKYEDFKTIRQEGKVQLRNYAEKMKRIALKEAEVSYQEEELLEQDKARLRVLADKQAQVAQERSRLMQTLEDYRTTRSTITSLQKEVLEEVDTERRRTAALGAACKASKGLLEAEMRRPSPRKTFPPKKEIRRAQAVLARCLAASSEELRAFHGEAILCLRRQERILLGRAKDAAEANGPTKGRAEDVDLTALREGHDSLENRIAARMFATPSVGDQGYADSEVDDGILLPPIETVEKRSSISRPKKFSILQNGEVERLQTKWAAQQKGGGGSSASEEWGQKKLVCAEEVIYDADAYSACCQGDYIRPHLLLDMHHGLGEREDRVRNLASVLCNAKGKVIQLNAIKEGLDAFLLKHAAMLLAFIEQLHPGVTVDTRSKSKVHYGSKPSSAADVPLTPYNRILQSDISRKDREIAHWKQRIYNQTFNAENALSNCGPQVSSKRMR